MKLILLLVAIHSLIFYQRYKNERSEVSPPEAKEVSKTKTPFQHPRLWGGDNYRNTDLLIRNSYPVYKFLLSREPQLVREISEF